MNSYAKFLFHCLALILLCTSAYAEDSVEISYIDGHPVMNRSSEWMSLRISRENSLSGIEPPSKRDVDHLFEKIAAVLADNAIENDWQLAIPDAPAIKISIELDGKKLKLISCHTILEQSGKSLVTETGAVAVSAKERSSVLARQTEKFQRNRIAFEAVLRLVLERTHARLSP